MEACAIVLAAGEGTRMKSNTPKVAHTLLGKPLIRWVVDAAQAAGVQEIVSVLGHAREQVIPLVGEETTIVFQEQRLGTADAVAVCEEALTGRSGSIIVLSGDCPLITPETIRGLVKKREENNAAVVVLTMEVENPFGYGRIVRNEQGGVDRIVEQKDCSDEQAVITECNSGFYCFDASILFEMLHQIQNNNAQGEFYLTDIIEICNQANRRVEALRANNFEECLGINSRGQLAQATKYMQTRINEASMAAGVTMTDPDLVWIGPDVVLAHDVELLPMTFLQGSTRIDEGSVIGPNSRLTDTVVGTNCSLEETVAISATLDSDVSCGPRAYLRPGTHMRKGSKAGTHVEIKNSEVGKDSKVPHLSYIGDATIGEDVNIGAGTITCNYDGTNKHRTTIGDGTFIGSDAMLVAPVTIGEHAIIGAGSTITKDVSAHALGIERAEQKEIPDWLKRKENSNEKSHKTSD